jgi:S-adenosylmethionine decarboxylase
MSRRGSVRSGAVDSSPVVHSSGAVEPNAAAAPATAVGSHLLADLHGIAPGLLRDAVVLERVLRAAADGAGAHVLASHFHSFGADEGVTGVVLLAESHISIHTWPEYGFAAADVFMCGASQPDRALAVLITALAPERQDIRSLARGEVSSRSTR